MAHEPRINDRIRADIVRTINEQGEQEGILPIADALSLALGAKLDLVEVAPDAKPPVCRIMDYGKYKYEVKKRSNVAKKKTHQVKTKEIRLRPKTDDNDLKTKINHARNFLEHHHRVLVNMLFRGREMAHLEMGKELIMKFAAELEDISKVEQLPRLEGRRMILVLSPK